MNGSSERKMPQSLWSASYDKEKIPEVNLLMQARNLQKSDSAHNCLCTTLLAVEYDRNSMSGKSTEDSVTLDYRTR